MFLSKPLTKQTLKRSEHVSETFCRVELLSLLSFLVDF